MKSFGSLGLRYSIVPVGLIRQQWGSRMSELGRQHQQGQGQGPQRRGPAESARGGGRHLCSLWTGVSEHHKCGWMTDFVVSTVFRFMISMYHIYKFGGLTNDTTQP